MNYTAVERRTISLLFNGWPAELADHRNVVFRGSDKVYLDRKEWAPPPLASHWWIGGPFPKDYWSPCPGGC